MILQILSGVHKGAELEVSAAGLRIGYGEQCDIELLDLGFDVQIHVRYNLTDGVFSVSDPDKFSCLVSPDGELLNEGKALHSAFLFLGSVIIHLGHQPEGEGWFVPAHIETKHQEYQSKDDDADLDSDTETSPLSVENHTPAHVVEHSTEIKKSTVNKPVLLCILACFAMFAIVLFVLLAPAEKLSFAQSQSMKPTPAYAPVASDAPVVGSGSETDGLEVLPEFTEAETALRWLVSAFNEAKLSQYLDVAQVGTQIRLMGALSEKDTQIFEGVISDWQQQFGERITLTAEIRKPINDLPFKIREVNPGPQGWVVTTENHYIYLGGIYKGFRLDKVERNRLIFGGKATLDITL